MIAFLRRPYGWAKLIAVILTVAFSFALLDAFVIPKTYALVETPSINVVSAEPEALTEKTSEEISEEIQESESAAINREGGETDAVAISKPVITANSYQDENIKIAIETIEKYDTTFYVAEIQLSDTGYLRTALAGDTYGRNIKATTSEMAASNNAILAINGDYYGFRDTGYVLRDGVLYRETGSGDALIIDTNGDFVIKEQNEITEDIIASAWQIFAFGPALVENGMVVVDASSEVSQSKNSNPRTAIGQISEGHYIVIVSDGRTDESEGLSLLQLASEFAQRGAETAYNLDGGGSSTMVFNGQLVNTPTSGRSNSERGVSDIVYFGYE